jgi:hypothetical protein
MNKTMILLLVLLAAGCGGAEDRKPFDTSFDVCVRPLDTDLRCPGASAIRALTCFPLDGRVSSTGRFEGSFDDGTTWVCDIVFDGYFGDNDAHTWVPGQGTIHCSRVGCTEEAEVFILYK